MKRIWIVLVVLALGVALAAPAIAAKPECPGNTCNNDTDGIGMTCEEAEALGFEHVVPTWTGAKTFEVVLDRASACVDVTAPAGAWTIDVVDVGSAREVYVAVQDSVNPGDTCWGVSDGGVTAVPAVFAPDLPASTVDACGLGEADEDPRLAFTAWYRAGKLKHPVIIEVTLP